MGEDRTAAASATDARASAPALALRGIRKAYHGTVVLDGVDLEVGPGEVHALVGENGAGKSTLMNVLFGMPVVHATGGFEGTVEIGGEAVVVRSPREAMALGIGMVHQEFMLLPGFTVAENVKLGREPVVGTTWGRILQLLDRPRMTRDTEASLERAGLEVGPGVVVGGLPVGHKQLVEIAREIDKEGTRVLVFDEPTAVLTEDEASRLLDVMRRLAKEGVAILFITHRLHEVLAVADRVTILRDGRRVFVGPTHETSIEEIAAKMVGRALEAGSAPTPPAASSGVALAVRGLRVDMPGEIVRGVDLEVRNGEILGIGGLAGQGKLGVANGLMGLVPATGEVVVEGRPLSLGSPRAAHALGLAFVSEDRRGVGLLLDEPLDVNVALPSVEVRHAFLRARWLGPLAWVDRRAVRAAARRWIEDLDIRTTGPSQAVRRLSGGNQQKVCLARALALAPRILLVSEPTRGIDVGAKALVLDRLVRQNREEGLTIVMTSSELAELRSICHRIAIVSEGRIAGVLPPDAPDARFGLLMSGEAA